MFTKASETTVYIQNKINGFKPQIGIILGSGLGGLVEHIDIQYSIEYPEIPNFPVSTVKGHGGRLVFGTLSGKNVIAMQGRFHYYEGYNMKEVAYPVLIMKQLGISHLIVSNASGGVNPNFSVGDIMLITGHINMMATNPLIGPNDDRLGTRFPSMHDAYDAKLIQKALDIGKKNNIKLQKGVYVALSGPTYETPAEYRMIRAIGGDAVGMSTVPETIMARYLGLDVFGLSVISDLGGGEVAVEVSHEEVLEAVGKSTPLVELLVKELIKEI